MKVQIISDIHLEYYNNDFRNFSSIIKPISDNIDNTPKVLFLAGDIGKIDHPTFKPFMDYVSENWDEIYYVAGNHEFYQTARDKEQCKTIQELEAEYDDFFLEYWNIYYLHNKYSYATQPVYHIWNEETGMLYFILGNTGWSYYDKEAAKYYNYTPNDSNYIYTKVTYCYGNGNIIPKKFNINDKDISNLSEKCLFNIGLTFDKSKTEYEYYKWNKIYEIEDKYTDKIKDVKFICLTHFPFANFEKTSHPDYQEQPGYLKSYFCNDYDMHKQYLNMYNIFISGHTHYSYDYKEGNVRFISNQKGYKDDLIIKNKGFKKDCIFEI